MGFYCTLTGKGLILVPCYASEFNCSLLVYPEAKGHANTRTLLTTKQPSCSYITFHHLQRMTVQFEGQYSPISKLCCKCTYVSSLLFHLFHRISNVELSSYSFLQRACDNCEEAEPLDQRKGNRNNSLYERYPKYIFFPKEGEKKIKSRYDIHYTFFILHFLKLFSISSSISSLSETHNRFCIPSSKRMSSYLQAP